MSDAIFETSDSTILGSAGDDTLTGGEQGDLILGDDGDDLIVGDIGRDTVKGGDGDDVIIGGQYVPSDDTIDRDADINLTEHTGVEVLYLLRPDPSGLAEFLYGGAGNDVIVGGNWADLNSDGVVDSNELWHESSLLEYQPGFANKIWAGAGDDTVHGANGFDTIGGGAGADFLYGNGGADIIYGGAGDDYIYGGDGDIEYFHQYSGAGSTITESLYGGTGNDHIWGEGGADIIYGGDGNDVLSGGEGDDTIDGGAGIDNIRGDEGDDILTGGEGADAFSFADKSGFDVITDFNIAEDSLYFDDIENQLSVDELLSMAEDSTVDGEAGLLLTMSGGVSIFLVGLDEGDIDSLMAHAGPIFTADV
ncbi:MAG: hypothetical protein HWE25_04415 [Alphaproteobacteria bacterium]|nr:hypothetical protein [Alphaproteobacteria bacterium]